MCWRHRAVLVVLVAAVSLVTAQRNSIAGSESTYAQVYGQNAKILAKLQRAAGVKAVGESMAGSIQHLGRFPRRPLSKFQTKSQQKFRGIKRAIIRQERASKRRRHRTRRRHRMRHRRCRKRKCSKVRRASVMTACPSTMDKQGKALLRNWDLTVAKKLNPRATEAVTSLLDGLHHHKTYLKLVNWVSGGHQVDFIPICGYLNIIPRVATHYGIAVHKNSLLIPPVDAGMSLGPGVAAVGRKPTYHKKRYLLRHNKHVLSKLHKSFAAQLAKMITALRSRTFSTYIKLDDPLPGGHIVDYSFVYGNPAYVRQVGHLIGLKVTRSQIELVDKDQVSIEAVTVEGKLTAETAPVKPEPIN